VKESKNIAWRTAVEFTNGIKIVSTVTPTSLIDFKKTITLGQNYDVVNDLVLPYVLSKTQQPTMELKCVEVTKIWQETK